MPARLNESVYLERYSQEGYAVLSGLPIQNSRSKVLLRCPKGHEYSSTPFKWSLGKRCQKCSTPKGFERHNWSELLAKLKDSGYSVEYEGVSKGRRIVGNCPVGHRLNISARATIRRGVSICRRCSCIATVTKEKLQIGAKLRRELELEGYSVLSLYDGQHSPLGVRCPKGHEYVVRAIGLTNGRRCRRCTRYKKAENELYEFCSGLAPDALQNQTGLLLSKRLELDVYIPSLRAAIELNGERWHSKEEVLERDARKAQECAELGIKLLVLPYKTTWFKDNKEHGKSLIRSFLKSEQIKP